VHPKDTALTVKTTSSIIITMTITICIKILYSEVRYSNHREVQMSGPLFIKFGAVTKDWLNLDNKIL
jgi:hypothetical protein